MPNTRPYSAQGDRDKSHDIKELGGALALKGSCAQMCSFFVFAFVIGDFALQSQLISDNKSQKAKDLHSSVHVC